MPLCKTWGNVSSGLLGKLCPTLPAPLIIDLHWSIIGWSHRHLLKAAWPSHPLRWRSIHDAARNARASQHQSLQHHAWHHIQMKLFDAVCGIVARDSWNDGARTHATVGHVANFWKHIPQRRPSQIISKLFLEIPEAPHAGDV